MLCVPILILFLYNKYKDKSEDTQHCWVGTFSKFRKSKNRCIKDVFPGITVTRKLKIEKQKANGKNPTSATKNETARHAVPLRDTRPKR